MTADRWYDVFARLSAEEPLDLDPLLSPPAASSPGEVATAGPVIRSARLWQRDGSVSHIGVRVDEVPRDLRRIALRLASAAVERGVIPVILSSLPRTGFEAYGFRVERLPEGPPEAVAAFEDELRRFWDMPIVISLSDVERLG